VAKITGKEGETFSCDDDGVWSWQEGSVAKITGKEGETFSGVAAVYDSEEDMLAALVRLGPRSYGVIASGNASSLFWGRLMMTCVGSPPEWTIFDLLGVFGADGGCGVRWRWACRRGRRSSRAWWWSSATRGPRVGGGDPFPDLAEWTLPMAG
jgi:hypothetical protein